MNAATVRGLRSQIKSIRRGSEVGIRDSSVATRDSATAIGDSYRRLPSFSTNPKSPIPNPDRGSVFLHRHEHFAVAAPHAELREASGLDLRQLARRVGGVRDRGAVHRQNDVALTQRAG